VHLRNLRGVRLFANLGISARSGGGNDDLLVDYVFSEKTDIIDSPRKFNRYDDGTVSC
jgi:hypothetical protein